MVEFYLVILLVMQLLWACYRLLVGGINFITKIKSNTNKLINLYSNDEH